MHESVLPFEGPIQGYVANYWHRHGWKVEGMLERDDCMAEAWIVWHRVARRYPDVEPRHFMALFKTSWTRHYTDLCNRATASRAACYEPALDYRTADTDNAGYVTTLVRQAPSEVKTVLSLLLNAPTEVLQVLWDTTSTRGPAAGNRLMCKWLGWPDNRQPLEEVRQHFVE